MTGIERLRKIGTDYAEHSWSEAGKGRGILMLNIADQIEREHACDADAIENIRFIVGGVVDEMERHVLGHEGMEDSPVARWARELRDALGGEKHDPAADVSVSAYDLLPADEREAIAWVRDHGGLDAVRSEWSSRVPYDKHEQRRQRLLGHIAECETALRRRNERIKELGHRVSDLTRENVELHKSAMPEGMEWPRFEDGEPVRFGDELLEFANTIYKDVKQIKFRSNGCVVIDNAGGSAERELVLWNNERVKRPAPKVLDADGAEIREGDTVWGTNGHGPFEVTRIVYADRLRVIADDEKNGHLNAYPEMLTHRAPVIAADGRPLREGETVWVTRDSPCDAPLDKGDEVTVRHAYPNNVSVEDKAGESWVVLPVHLAHERPVADTWERLEEDAKKGSCDYFGYDANGCNGCPAYGWNVTRGGNGCGNAKMADLVRRAKALAERERGE